MTDRTTELSDVEQAVEHLVDAIQRLGRCPNFRHHIIPIEAIVASLSAWVEDTSIDDSEVDDDD